MPPPFDHSFAHKIPDVFGPLMSARAVLRPHHEMQLDSIYQHVWATRVPVREWSRSLRAALSLLENGFENHPEEMAPLVFSTVEKQTPIQMEVAHLGRPAWSAERADSPDARFRPLLDFYTCLYERWYPLLIAPFVGSDCLLRTSETLADVVHDDGRVSLRRVQEMETARSLPHGLLTAGLERHLRNSISHGRYEVLNRDSIRMEDRNPAGNSTWGPHVFIQPDLAEKVFRLHITGEALLAALVLFDVNNGRLIVERNFIERKSRRRRIDVIEATVGSFARRNGLKLLSATTDLHMSPDERKIGEALHLTLTALNETVIDQTTEILEGGDGWARKWKQRIYTADAPLREQLYALLQQTWDMHEAIDDVRVDYVDDDGEPLGSFLADHTARETIRDGLASPEEVAAALAADTIPDVTIPVVIKEPPIEV